MTGALQAETSLSDLRYAVVLNSRAGSAWQVNAHRIEDLADKHGLRMKVDADESVPLSDRLMRSGIGDADVIVAAGGDGTATAAAEAVRGTGKLLAILPLGTANLLAHDLGLPIAVDEWMAALPFFEPRRIDAGEVNGRLFLEQVVIGAVVEAAASREAVRNRRDPAAAVEFMTEMVRRLSYTGPFEVEIATGGGKRRIEKVEALSIANNEYDEGIGRFFTRARLDRGTLGLYVIHRLRPLNALRLAAEVLLGVWQRTGDVEFESTEEVTIHTRRQVVRAMVDGEITNLEAPIKVRILPKSLCVLAPPLVTSSQSPDPGRVPR
jgi:diacylglycerol kinase family enzyme